MQISPNNLKKAIVATIAYFDIFDFPVTEEEIIQFLHTSTPIDQQDIKKYLSLVDHKRYEDKTFYFLPHREFLVKKRLEREKISKKKIFAKKRIIQILGFLPTINFIGISGSLALGNGDDESDIDLFIITLAHSVWLTRFFVWLILLITGNGRKRNTFGKDKVCVNMLIDASILQFSAERRDIYTAHEINQVVPVVNKYQTFQFFLSKNAWTESFLPKRYEITHPFMYKIPIWMRIISFLLIPIESLLQRIQLFYMKKHKTIEKTTAQFIAFHPTDYRSTIVKAYEKKLQEYSL